MLKTSPSGSLCPYYYMGGELHPLKYGSQFDRKEELLAVMKAEEAFILQSPGRHNRRIWVDLYETVLDDEVIAALVDHIIAIEPKIHRICLVGCSGQAERKLRKRMRSLGMEIEKVIRFDADPERAKQWLVGAAES